MSQQDFKEATPVSDLSPGRIEEGLFVMPERINDEGVGFYGDESPEVYKELKRMGAKVNYYTEERRSIHRLGFKEDIFAFAIGFFISDLPKSVAYDLLKAYIMSKFKARPNAKVTGEINIASELNGFSTWQNYKVTGDLKDALTMIDKIQEIQNREHSSRNDIVK